MLKFERLYSPNYQIFLINCVLDCDVLKAGLSLWSPDLKPGHVLLSSDAVSVVCEIEIADEFITNTGMIMTSEIEIPVSKILCPSLNSL